MIDIDRIEYEDLNTSILSEKYCAGFPTLNRYENILPVDDTRVKLRGDKYINANYVDQYICTQSPTLSTIVDFWHMIVEQNVQVIVMLNKLKEGNIVKGDRYWPEIIEEKMNIGDIQLVTKSVYTMFSLEITVRKIEIKYGSNRRYVYHLHYQGWPDFGVPMSTLPIRELYKLMKYYLKPDTRPVIHCSAGIGRSGVFLAIVMALEKNDTHLISIKQIVLRIRKQRNRGSVQTLDQYKFISTVIKDEFLHQALQTNFSGAVNTMKAWDIQGDCSGR